MNEKSVTDLAGIGEVLGKRLEAKGFDKVSKGFKSKDGLMYAEDISKCMGMNPT